MKWPFSHEHHNRQDKAKKPDYLDVIRCEGENFDRGGSKPPSLVQFRGNQLVINQLPFFADDKISLINTLERHWKSNLFAVSQKQVAEWRQVATIWRCLLGLTGDFWRAFLTLTKRGDR